MQQRRRWQQHAESWASAAAHTTDLAPSVGAMAAAASSIMFSSPRGWSAEEDSDDDDGGPSTVVAAGRAEEGRASPPPETWAALADVREGNSAAETPIPPRRDRSAAVTRRPNTASAKPGDSLLERLVGTNAANPMRQTRSRRAKSAGAARPKPSFTRGAALTDAAAPPAPTPELVAEGTSTGGTTPREDRRPWLQVHKDHSTASPVVAQVADSEMLSYLNETFTFWHSRGNEAKWMLMRLGTDAFCSTKPMGWVLASELVLRNQQPDLGSLSAFLATMSLEGHAHGLRGLGVTDVESLALQTDETFAEAGLPAPARRILRRALVAHSRELEVADGARRRQQTAPTAEGAPISAALSGDCVRPQTAADFRNRVHDGTTGMAPRFSSAASLGIGEDWLKGQRPSARARRKRRQQRDGSGSPTRPSTAPPRNSASVDGIISTRDSSEAPQHRQGFVGSSSSGNTSDASFGVMSNFAAHVVADRISASGSWLQDNRRFSGGGFALSNRIGPSVSEPVLIGNPALPHASGQPPASLSQVVLSCASSIVGKHDSSRGQESRQWLDSVATGNSLRRANKARSAVKTQSSFGRVGMRPEGTQDEAPLQPAALAFVVDDPTLFSPQPLPRARPGYVWCARPGGGFSQMTVAQRKSWLDERMRCGEPIPAQVDPQGQPLPSTVRGEAAREISVGEERVRAGSSKLLSTWQLQEPHVGSGDRASDPVSMTNMQPATRALVGPQRQRRKVLLHTRTPSVVQVHVTTGHRRQHELLSRGQATRRSEPGQANVWRGNGGRATSTAMQRTNKRGNVGLLVTRSVQPAHDLVWKRVAAYA